MRHSAVGRRGRSYFLFSLFSFLSVFICAHLWLIPAARAQEVVVNLSAGRVIVCVAKGGMVVATVQKRIEAESRPPVLAQLSAKRVAIFLGAAEWVSPAGEPPVRLEREMRGVMGGLASGPRLSQEQANDLEGLGMGLLEPLRKAAQRLVMKVDLQRDEPLLDVVLAGYLDEYGAEAWTLRYRAVQEPLRGEYWQTRVLRPIYTQLYPPEKDQPRTIMETRYPPEDDAPLLLDLLRANDPRLARLRNADEKSSEAAVKILEGESHKAPLEGVVALLRGALTATLAEDETLAFGVVNERDGFTWIVSPPEPVQRVEEGEKKERPAGAPTLRRPPQ